MAGRVEAVTCIELVEHLQPAQLDSFSCAVLGVIRPRVWVVTTPNREYNELFPDWPGSDQSQQHDAFHSAHGAVFANKHIK